ncbi:hypothetical protein AMELA_G00031840 [Ameiurus melas]|uniref:Uncharacterized protein n=1 Tax=Ameiurus melas TaxID=219545 RepID=A0A7J6B965_AMEME|nr:hypothetical protein AMELA_G00031840 [Ameiurus melas]
MLEYSAYCLFRKLADTYDSLLSWLCKILSRFAVIIPPTLRVALGGSWCSISSQRCSLGLRSCLHGVHFILVAGEPGAYPREHRAQGGVHPGQGASPSQVSAVKTAFVVKKDKPT